VRRRLGSEIRAAPMGLQETNWKNNTLAYYDEIGRARKPVVGGWREGASGVGGTSDGARDGGEGGFEPPSPVSRT